MSKFFCLCGDDFRNKESCDIHLKLHQNLDLRDGYIRHQIFERGNKYRFFKWLTNLDFTYCSALISGLVINSLFLCHSNWSFSCQFMESICAGFLLPALLNKRANP